MKPGCKYNNEPRYCICNQVSYGDMVACDNDDVSTSYFWPFWAIFGHLGKEILESFLFCMYLESFTLPLHKAK